MPTPENAIQKAVRESSATLYGGDDGQHLVEMQRIADSFGLPLSVINREAWAGAARCEQADAAVKALRPLLARLEALRTTGAVEIADILEQMRATIAEANLPQNGPK